jgi:diphthine synthase
MVESASDDILADAQNVDVAFLVVGDPFGFVYRLLYLKNAPDLNFP